MDESQTISQLYYSDFLEFLYESESKEYVNFFDWLDQKSKEHIIPQKDEIEFELLLFEFLDRYGLDNYKRGYKTAMAMNKTF